MGFLLNGAWHGNENGFAAHSGEFERKASAFRSFVTADGAAGPTGAGGFKAENGRYHLYVSLACPWAHRALVMRERKHLADAVSLSVVNWHMGEQGWTFEAGRGVIPDTVNHKRTLHEVYTAADPAYSGRCTVPVLWDKERRTIVSNESSEIIRMFDEAFDAAGAEGERHRPAELAAEIDAVNARVYDTVNNGVYKAGFAERQGAYDRAVTALFESLDWLDERLSHSEYLVGGRLTEADIRLYTTLVRFDAVYHGHFKCNVRRIVDYPALWHYLRRLYALDGFGTTTDHFHIKHHYYESHRSLNPSGIVPAGPELDFTI